MIKKLARRIRNFFGFTTTEANGFIFLLFLAVFLLLAPLIFKSIFSVKYDNKPEDQAMLDSLMKVIEAHQEQVKLAKYTPTIKKPRPFDPNKSSADELAGMGVPHEIAARIVKYREAYGSYQQKADLKKIYGLDSILYGQLEPYIAIKHTSASTKKKNAAKNPQEQAKPTFDINKVDSMALRDVPGIGKVLSARIVKYRDILGGYHSEGQLKEVYGLSDYGLKNLQAQTYIPDQLELRKVNINKAGFKDLLAHPYIDYDFAQKIVQFREDSGRFTYLEDLTKKAGCDSLSTVKLAPYLSF